MSKSTKSIEALTEPIRISKAAHDIALKVKAKTGVNIGRFVSEAIKEKTRRDHPELINKTT